MSIGRVALLWRGDAEMRAVIKPERTRLKDIFAALAAAGVEAEPVVYSEAFADEVRAHLLTCDGVLVWVDPLSDGKTRAELDPLLREVAARGTWVSAHPETILRMGTKEVLYRTRHLGWGVDTHIYRTQDAFRSDFPARLTASQPRVLKQNRGNGGQGVWKVERLDDGRVRVLEGRRGSVEELLQLQEFLQRCEPYFGGEGLIVDQPFQPRLPEGMIRCYMASDRVVGFGHQLIRALIPPPAAGPDSPEAQPGPRIMHPQTAPQFQRLRNLMEDEWVPRMMEAVGLSREDLPIVWDADFLYGPRNSEGQDAYVLCEINVSAVLPIPDQAPEEMARLVAERLHKKRGAGS